MIRITCHINTRSHVNWSYCHQPRCWHSPWRRIFLSLHIETHHEVFFPSTTAFYTIVMQLLLFVSHRVGLFLISNCFHTLVNLLPSAIMLTLAVEFVLISSADLLTSTAWNWSSCHQTQCWQWRWVGPIGVSHRADTCRRVLPATVLTVELVLLLSTTVLTLAPELVLLSSVTVLSLVVELLLFWSVRHLPWNFLCLHLNTLPVCWHSSWRWLCNFQRPSSMFARYPWSNGKIFLV